MILKKVSTTEAIKTEVDGQVKYYYLKIESIERNKFRIATVLYIKKKMVVDQTLPICEKGSIQILDTLASRTFRNLYNHLRNEG